MTPPTTEAAAASTVAAAAPPPPPLLQLPPPQAAAAVAAAAAAPPRAPLQPPARRFRSRRQRLHNGNDPVVPKRPEVHATGSLGRAELRLEIINLSLQFTPSRAGKVAGGEATRFSVLTRQNQNCLLKHSASSRRALDGLRCVVARSVPQRLQLLHSTDLHGDRGRQTVVETPPRIATPQNLSSQKQGSHTSRDICHIKNMFHTGATYGASLPCIQQFCHVIFIFFVIFILY
jgi:hypothetical protein